MAMVSTDIHTQVHEALRELANRCNGASSRDGTGFNKLDAYNGKSMAQQDELTPSQVLYGAKMLQKYHNQITVPDLQAAKRYFAINGPRRDDSVVAIEEDNDDSYEDEQMEEENAQPKSADIVLSAEQQALFKVMEGTRQHLFITGRAGTGKSVLLRHFRENTKKRIVVAAPTGIAALNVRGQTIHSLFRLPPQFHRKGSLAPNSKICSVLKRIDTIVIDEISMVRADLLDAIDERMREAFGNSLPFGGVQIIMFGDCYQLPPVVEEGLMSYFEHAYGGYFFFHADVWKQTDFKIYELSQVFRQKDPTFKNILNVIRDGTATDDQIEQLNGRCGVSVPKEGTITLATTNNLVTTINQRRLNQLPGKAFEYKAIITGEMKRGTFPTEEIIQLKIGAQVVLLQNDKDRRWVNGTVATVSSLEKEGIAVHVDGIDYGLEQTTWEEIRYEYDPAAGKVKEEVTSSFTQYPVRLAWAMTIHKSQGQTYESVALDLSTPTFAPGQLYVALSRATSLEGLYLKMPVLRKHIIVEPKVAAFMARRETITVEVVEEETQAVVVEAFAPVEQPSTTLASFFDQSIQDAASRGFTVQSVVAEPIIASVAAEPATTPEPSVVAIETPMFVYPTIQPRGKTKKDLKGVAYNFPTEVANQLDQATTLIQEKYGEKLDKSAYIAGVLTGQYPNLIELLAQLQDQDHNPDPDNGGGFPLPVTSEAVEEKQEPSSTLANFFSMAIEDAASRGFTVQAIVGTPQEAMPNVALENVNTPMLFEDAPVDPEKAYRRFYHCGSKFCKHKWGYDYRYDNALNEFYRLDANGKRISAEQDAICPKCGNDGKYTKKRTLRALYHAGKRCTASCKNATSDECDCVCGGSAHGKAHMQGVVLLKPPTK